MKSLKVSVLSMLLFVLAGCGGGGNVEVIDLNRVLDVMVSTLDSMQAPMGSKKADDGQETPEKAAFMTEFNGNFAADLNAAKLMSQPIGTEVNADGSITGFTDANKNMMLDGSDKKVFKVEIDAERSRLIATDLQNGYHRDSGFSMAGLAVGMLVGSMLSRQRGAGINSSKFSNMKMSPKNYHSSAVAKAKSSARSKSGSGSFSKGK